MLRSLLFLFLFVQAAYAQQEAYSIFDSKGRKLNVNELVKISSQADVVFFGELHDNPIGHWLQLELLKGLHTLKKSELVAGAEMFEADDQLPLNEYLKGKITEKTFTPEVKLWPNYKTDYKPLIEFCKSNNVPFIATNVPRRYANMVYLKGITALDSVDQQARLYIAPLPFPYDPELKTYKEIFSGAGHGGANLPYSQALKDATMAHFISANISKGKSFIHFNGTYHTNYNEGICWYLKKNRPALKQLTIAMVEQENISELEKENMPLADVIIVVDKDMTKTH